MQAINKPLKKILKYLGSISPANKVRIYLLNLAGYCIGNQVYIGEGFLVIDKLQDRKNVIIGDRVSIAPRVICITASDPNNSKIAPYVTCKHGTVTIEDDAWIGAGSIIMPDVSVGAGAVVGAGSVVTKNVESYTVVAGVPARKIKKIDLINLK
ncbi:DapH/DapD/GlmU-related protein [Methanolobus sediminis]|uniref:DapH/DapD/GlmU-related protein n=1 Tax=Methanolobus sediminis TaxID=3072978 RepID=A0AA51YJC1_9EURY|nr:DapH/DapD/GlmU-related protein [Methanolobus sediminis]WMW25436.1 DapH/DapD/GlmU-related protein [Methanolobus sediminis]